MGDILTTFAAPIVEVIGEKTVEFKRLDLSELAKLSAIVVAQRKDQARKLNKEAPVTNYELFTILQEIEDRPPTVGELIARTSTSKGTQDVLRQSLLKTYKAEEAEEVLKAIEPVFAISIAQALLYNQTLKTAEPKKENPEPTTTADSNEGKN